MTPGICRFCGCTETTPCKVPGGDACSWFDRCRTVCTAPACVTAYYKALDAAGLAAFNARPRKRTPAEIHQLIRRRKKPARRMLKGPK